MTKDERRKCTEASCLVTGAIECIEDKKDSRQALVCLNDALEMLDELV